MREIRCNLKGFCEKIDKAKKNDNYVVVVNCGTMHEGYLLAPNVVILNCHSSSSCECPPLRQGLKRSAPPQGRSSTT
eukprot:471744-Amphidinium_carterae.1